ncbi:MULTISPECIES: LptA/OstA family protein [unclassified Candidatus Frackibacter]|uniref:LptA/OstA family protein n=1 Tax=unclassified Candidatus Frackibacter TaxID=2648818 RepID=UPI0008861113|nr:MULTISPECIES: LptA/OstA family protein [unclassified Candidatus Frackibacter]SDC09141.1 lipopolysaccharide export system protein LptA [Candidatus Frackibacter sp. WG11]SEM37931.1 lipopolysaccharide export system protein LptA [Candidatus Frackibacter sp. WG12]SFL43411.1 lipopolysaccharide export system protein LptA [Candidatus Frackibacter sp. WG13]
MKRRISSGLVILVITLLLVNLGSISLLNAKETPKEKFEILANEMVLDKDTLIAKGEVKITTEQGKMTGDRFKADNLKGKGLLTGNPLLINEGWKVSGNRFEINFDKEEVFVPQNAHIESETLVADAKHLLLLGKKEEVILTGEVTVINQERKLTGDKVVIDLKTEKIRSMGRSRLTLPGDELNSGAEE